MLFLPARHIGGQGMGTRLIRVMVNLLQHCCSCTATQGFQHQLHVDLSDHAQKDVCCKAADTEVPLGAGLLEEMSTFVCCRSANRQLRVRLHLTGRSDCHTGLTLTPGNDTIMLCGCSCHSICLAACITLCVTLVGALHAYIVCLCLSLYEGRVWSFSTGQTPIYLPFAALDLDMSADKPQLCPASKLANLAPCRPAEAQHAAVQAPWHTVLRFLQLSHEMVITLHASRNLLLPDCHTSALCVNCLS